VPAAGPGAHAQRGGGRPLALHPAWPRHGYVPVVTCVLPLYWHLLQHPDATGSRSTPCCSARSSTLWHVQWSALPLWLAGVGHQPTGSHITGPGCAGAATVPSLYPCRLPSSAMCRICICNTHNERMQLCCCGCIHTCEIWGGCETQAPPSSVSCPPQHSAPLATGINTRCSKSMTRCRI
jgi:hypothetical protein